MYVFTSWILFIILSPLRTYSQFSINEVDCNEIISMEDSTDGIIETLGYPEPYPERRHCKVVLKGDSEHKVVLTFNDFYLFHPLGHHHKKYSSCDGLDTLRIYDGLGEQFKILGEYCGGMKPPSLMSSGPNLSLKLTSYTSGTDAKGYSANYSFVNDYGITSGKQQKVGKCAFEFNSNIQKEGVITGPNPGGLYPRNTNCSYIFTGTFLQRVFLEFRNFDLEGIEPCTAKSGSDFLEFSNFPNLDPCPSRRCGRFTPEEVVSEGPYFRVTFRSNDRLSGLGFTANYSFLSDDELPEWASYLRGYANKIDVLRQTGSLLVKLWICLLFIGMIT